MSSSPDDDGVSAIGPYLGHLKTQAVRAIARLVSGTLAQPIIRQVQEAENLAEARAIFSRGLAELALEEAKGDPALVRRFMRRIAAEGLVAQANREAIAVLAAEELTREPPVDTADISGPDEDWLARFAGYAETVSNDELQRLWARVLAGEVRAPGSFSLRTLRSIAEIDREAASTFERNLPFIVAESSMLARLGGELMCDVRDITVLVDAGLVVGVPTTLSAELALLLPNSLVLDGRAHRLVIRNFSFSAGTFRAPAYKLTNAGRQVLQILELPDEVPLMKKIGIFAVQELRGQPPTYTPSAFIFRKEAGRVGGEELPRSDYDESEAIWERRMHR